MAPCNSLAAFSMTEPAVIIPELPDSFEEDGRPPVVCLDLGGDASNAISCAVQTALLGWGWYFFLRRGVPDLMPCGLLPVHIRSIGFEVRQGNVL
jgi:hypothetical protein